MGVGTNHPLAGPNVVGSLLLLQELFLLLTKKLLGAKYQENIANVLATLKVHLSITNNRRKEHRIEYLSH